MKMNKTDLAKVYFPFPPKDLSQEFSDYACVSVILKFDSKGPHLAFIKRAINPKDPWSGQIAFPGGRKEAQDKNDFETAQRETFEEVGWELQTEHFLGYLTDLRARNKSGWQNFFLRPVVFFTNSDFATTKLDAAEVAEVFWLPISYLADQQHSTTIAVVDRGLNLPAIRLPDGAVLWGLTHLIVSELIQRLGDVGMTFK